MLFCWYPFRNQTIINADAYCIGTVDANIDTAGSNILHVDRSLTTFSKFVLAIPVHAVTKIGLTSIHTSTRLYSIENIELKLASWTLPRMG